MELTETRLDQTMKKMAKVLHMSNGKSFCLSFYPCMEFIADDIMDELYFK